MHGIENFSHVVEIDGGVRTLFLVAGCEGREETGGNREFSAEWDG